MQRSYRQQKTKIPACLQVVHSFLHLATAVFTETLLSSVDTRMAKIVHVLAFVQKMEMNKEKYVKHSSFGWKK